VPTSHSQSVLGSLGADLVQGGAKTQDAASPGTTVFVIASPRPATGKTFLARLVTDYQRVGGRDTEAFDLSPGEISLIDFLPGLTTRADLSSTSAQMALFDRLILADGVARVVDLGFGSFQRFFTTVEEIGFLAEAERRAIQIVILFAADAYTQSVQAYVNLMWRFPNTVLVPVFNEGILKGQRLRDLYKFSSAATVPLQIPALLQALRVHTDRPGHSFADFHSQLPMPVPIGAALDLRSWTRRTFLEFREFELRLLMEKLRASLKV
jgi:hypothetical protein